MIFQTEQHAAFLGRLEALAEAIDHPFESILIGIAFDLGLDATVLHELVEILGRLPSAGVDTHGGNAELISQLDAVNGVIDVFLPLGRVWIQKSLMDGEPAQVQTEEKGATL